MGTWEAGSGERQCGVVGVALAVAFWEWRARSGVLGVACWEW